MFGNVQLFPWSTKTLSCSESLVGLGALVCAVRTDRPLYAYNLPEAALSIYPRESICTTVGCGNTRPLKKETSREVVVYTAANGVQAAWAIHLYCPGKCRDVTSLNILVQPLGILQYVKPTTTTTLPSTMENAHITRMSHSLCKLASINLFNGMLSRHGLIICSLLGMIIIFEVT